MTDYHLGPLFRFVPNILYKLGLMKLGDSITDTIEAVMETDLSTSPVTTTDVFHAHNQQNNWWYTGDGDLIVWSYTDPTAVYPASLPLLYYLDYKIRDVSGGTIFAAGASGTDFYFVAQYSNLLQVYYADLTDTELEADGSYTQSEIIAELNLTTCVLSIVGGNTNLSVRTGPNLAFLAPAFNADCSELKIGIGTRPEKMYQDSAASVDVTATCATLTLSGINVTAVTPFIWDGAFSLYDSTTVQSITNLPVADTFNPNFLPDFEYTLRLTSHAYVIGDRIHSSADFADTWEASSAGTSGSGALDYYDMDNVPHPTITDGAITWTYIGHTYDDYDPADWDHPVEHAGAEMLAYTGIGNPYDEINAAIGPARYGTLEEILTAAEGLSTGSTSPGGNGERKFTRVITTTKGPSSFGSSYHTKLAPQYPYPTDVTGLYLSSLTPADPGLHRIAEISIENYQWDYDSSSNLVGYLKETLTGKYEWDGINPEVFTAGDFSEKWPLLSCRALFTYFGSRPLSGSVITGSKGYTGAIPVGWTLSGGVMVDVDIRQTAAENYSGSATGTSGRRGQYGHVLSPFSGYDEIGDPFLTPDIIAHFADSISTNGSYTLARDLVTTHKSGLYIGGALQAEMYPLEPGTTLDSSLAFKRAIEYNLDATGSVTYATQTGLTPNQLTFSENETVSYRRSRQQILGWNYSGKCFYVERAEMTSALTTETKTSYTHIAEYRINGALAHSRSFAWGANANIKDFSLDDNTYGFGYCYTQPIVVGGDILFSTFHSYSDPGNFSGGFGVGSTANADQFNWLVASDGTVVTSVNMDSGTITINAAFNNDATRQHIALGYTWGL